MLQPDTEVDGAGAAIYGSVLYDGGRYRMWCQAWPAAWDGSDVSLVGYAESDDGITWCKPNLGIVDRPRGEQLRSPALCVAYQYVVFFSYESDCFSARAVSILLHTITGRRSQIPA